MFYSNILYMPENDCNIYHFLVSGVTCPTGYTAEPSHPNLCYKDLALTKTNGEMAAPKCPMSVAGATLPIFRTLSELLSFRKWM